VPEFESAGWWQKPAAEMRCVECVKCGETKELPKFDVGQKGIGGWCTLCQRKETEKRAQLEWRNQKIPRGMRLTSADPRYASRDDDKQGATRS